MRISHRKKIALAFALLLIVSADIYAIANRAQQVASSPISWVKVSGSILLQVVVLASAYVYLAWLERRPKLELPPYGSLESWRSRVVPIVIFAVIAGFSTDLFYNGVVCGGQPMPTVRGVGLCR